MGGEITSSSEGIRLLREDFRDHRQAFASHEERDRQDFKAVTSKVEDINERLTASLSEAALFKWVIGLCLPVILGALVAIWLRIPMPK